MEAGPTTEQSIPFDMEDPMYVCMVQRKDVIGEELSKTFKCFCEFKTLGSGLGTFAQDIFAYDAEGDTYWALDERGSLLPNIRRVCTLRVDLSGLQKFLNAQKTSEGRDFWKAFYTVNVFLVVQP